MARFAVQRVEPQPRHPRRPQHTAYIKHAPWVIQPFLIAPVLPGETLKRLEFQARAVSAPLSNPIVGHWLEHYVFYIKHRDLAGRADFTEMMTDLNKDMSAYNAADAVNTYHNGPSIDWTKHCLVEVTERYFRHEGQAWNVSGSTTTLTPSAETMPLAQVNKPGWMDSLILQSTIPATTLVDEAGAGTLTSQELDVAQRAWEFLRSQNMTELSYEDYLRTFGISVPRPEELHMPELIRYSREWSYPTNTVDPQSGVPSTAASFAVRFSADKDRLFKEPGFIFGCSIWRPKVYAANQNGAAVGMLNDAFSWLPAVMRDDPATSLKALADNTGPLLDAAVPAGGYLADIRDLFLYGDQFTNETHAEAGAGSTFINRLPLASIPVTTTLVTNWPTAANIQEIFPLVDDSPLTYSTDIYMRQDMVVNMEILGTQIDQTPTGMVRGLAAAGA